MFGCTASIIFSNWARVITVLQSAAGLLADCCSHIPLMVMTGASGGTSAALGCSAAGLPAAVLGAALVWAAGFWAGAAGAVCEFAAWLHASAPSNRQTNPYRVILGIPPGKLNLRNKNPSTNWSFSP